jgi:hemoglobin
MQKHDIETASDIDVLIDDFYTKLLAHADMKPFFEHIDVAQHLPHIKQFWRFSLLNEPGYSTNVFDKHAHLGAQTKHFEIWVQLFCETVDTHFEGDRARDAKIRARTLGFTFASKLEHLRNLPNE